MDSRQFVVWLEAKLQAHGVTKFIPDDPDILAQSWKRAWQIQELNRRMAKAAKDLPAPPAPPDDLGERVRAALKQQPSLRWDVALLEAHP